MIMWCFDCKCLDMFIDEIVDENIDKVWFKIDKDEFEEFFVENNVMGIFFFFLYKNGEKIVYLYSVNVKMFEVVCEFLVIF